MAANKKLIGRVELTTSAASITLSSIPQNCTHLLLVTSLRDDSGSTGWENAFIYPNGSSANMTSRFLFGWSSNVGSAVNTPSVIYHQTSRGGNEANTFSSSSVIFSNYANGSPKGISCETTVERNNAAGINAITAALWNDNSPVTSLVITAASGNFVAGSSAALYGITRGSDGITTVS